MRETQAAGYLKLAVLLVPREHKVEQTNTIGQLTDEQLETMIEELKERIARRAAGEQAKVIEGTVDPTVVETSAPPAERDPPKRPVCPLATRLAPYRFTVSKNASAVAHGLYCPRYRSITGVSSSFMGRSLRNSRSSSARLCSPLHCLVALIATA